MFEGFSAIRHWPIIIEGTQEQPFTRSETLGSDSCNIASLRRQDAETLWNSSLFGNGVCAKLIITRN
jgi:hypothetical protein